MSTITSSSSPPPPPPPPPQPSSPPPESVVTTSSASSIIPSDITKTDNKQELQIFLGGSCNPTTWRKNVAIPYLEMKGISYYNPQVDNWTPEVVKLERYAKQNAKVVLSVIDKQTRSTVSIVESAFMAGKKKNLVLVVYPFEYNIVSLSSGTQFNQTSNIETTSELMKTSRASKSIAKSSSISSSSSSSSSTTSSTLISTTADKSNSNATVSSSTTTTTTTTTTLTARTMCSTTELDQNSLKKTHEEASFVASGTFKMSGEVISLKEFEELKQARYILQNLLAFQKIPMFSDILQALKYVTCCLGDNVSNQAQITDLPQNINSPLTVEANSTQFLAALPPHNDKPSSSQNVSSQQQQQQQQHQNRSTNISNDHLKDLYLSLEADDHSSIESLVIPILEEKGLTYNCMYINDITELSHLSRSNQQPVGIISRFSLDSQNIINEQLSRYSEGTFDMCEITKLALEKEISAIQSSRVLLFVITNKCRGLSIMVLASHFMALFRNNVVLCVQYLEEPCSIGGETLSQSAIADYNRGRLYLNDYAVQSQVPVFGTIREAIECCSRKCRYDNKS